MPDNSAARLLTNEPEPAMFVILKAKHPDPSPRRREITEYGDVGDKNAVAMFKIDEAGNLSVNFKSIGNDPVKIRKEGLVQHH